MNRVCSLALDSDAIAHAKYLLRYHTLQTPRIHSQQGAATNNNSKYPITTGCKIHPQLQMYKSFQSSTRVTRRRVVSSVLLLFGLRFFEVNLICFIVILLVVVFVVRVNLISTSLAKEEIGGLGVDFIGNNHAQLQIRPFLILNRVRVRKGHSHRTDQQQSGRD